MRIKYNALGIALAGLALSACSEGQYWDGPATITSVCAFEKPAMTVNLEPGVAFPQTIDITVSRTNAKEAATYPVELTPNKVAADIISGPASISFAAGETSATYTFNVASTALSGTSYAATLSLDFPEDTNIEIKEENRTFTLSLYREMIWKDAGTAATTSDWWVGNPEPVVIPVQHAIDAPVEGLKLMRLVSPYWYLEPEYAEPGANIQFYLTEDDQAYSIPGYQYIGENSDGDYFFIGFPASLGCSFTNEGNVFSAKGTFVYGPSPTKFQYYYDTSKFETLEFTWSDYQK